MEWIVDIHINILWCVEKHDMNSVPKETHVYMKCTTYNNEIAFRTGQRNVICKKMTTSHENVFFLLK